MSVTTGKRVSIGMRATVGARVRGTRVSGVRAVAAGFAVIAGAAVLTAPTAAATATRVGIEAGISFGSATNYGTGCSYAVDVYVDDPVTPVVFYDNGVPFTSARPSGQLATARWTPGTTGAHRLEAIQYSAPGEDVRPYVDVWVGTGLSTGSGCNVLN